MLGEISPGEPACPPISAVQNTGTTSECVLATTTNRDDDVLAAFAASENLRCFRGSEADVMGRVIGAAEAADADVIVEITGDCPLIDPDIIEQTIQMFLHHDAAYVSNCHIRSYPDGMDTQVFRLDSLRRSAALTDELLDREHVTLHMRHNPHLFPAVHLIAPPSLHWPELGLTLDEESDYRLLTRIIEAFEPSFPLFSCADVIQLLRERPDLVEVNRHVPRKGDT